MNPLLMVALIAGSGIAAMSGSGCWQDQFSLRLREVFVTETSAHWPLTDIIGITKLSLYLQSPEYKANTATTLGENASP